jgi:hypothetical protein
VVILVARSAVPGSFIEQPRSAAKLGKRGHRESHAKPQIEKPLTSCEDSGFRLVAKGGIEPPTRGFSVRCSTN